jgi:hypothetical protein
MLGWLIPWLITMKVKGSIPSCDTYKLRPTSGPHMSSGGYNWVTCLEVP